MTPSDARPPEDDLEELAQRLRGFGGPPPADLTIYDGQGRVRERLTAAEWRRTHPILDSRTYGAERVIAESAAKRRARVARTSGQHPRTEDP